MRTLRKCGVTPKPNQGKGSHTWVQRLDEEGRLLTREDGKACQSMVMDRTHSPTEVRTILKQLDISEDEFLAAW